MPRPRRLLAFAAALAAAAACLSAGAAYRAAFAAPLGGSAQQTAPLARALRGSGQAGQAGQADQGPAAAEASGLTWFWAAALAVVVAVSTVASPALAEVAGVVVGKGEATGFAEYAKKGGAMKADPSCFITSCGKETKECFVEDGRCLKGALCLARCRGDPDCATQCFAEYGCPRLDRWLNCTVETKQCVSVPEGTYDVKKFYATDVPQKLKDFDVSKLDGLWYKVRGYNAKYDCYSCQTNKFKYDAATNTIETEVKLRLERKRTGGYWPNTLTEKAKVSAPGDRSTLVAEGAIFGLSFHEEWYVLAADEDFVLVAYTGNNLQDAYKGGYVYTRTPTLTPEVEAKAKAAAAKSGFEWAKFCVVDNSCPAVKDNDYSQPVTLGLEDLPDLIEWFAPGTTRGGTVKDASFTGDY